MPEPKRPSDPSRRHFLATGTAALAGLAVARPGQATPAVTRVSWSAGRACPGDEVLALAEAPGAPDGHPVVFRVRGPDGSRVEVGSACRGGRAEAPVRLDLPATHARPGQHVFELTVAGGGAPEPARVEVVAARFSFGL